MANVVEAKIMKHHQAPVVFLKLIVDMPGDIIVDFCKVLWGHM